MNPNRIAPRDDIITLNVDRGGSVTHCLGLIHAGEIYTLAWQHATRAAALRVLGAWAAETDVSADVLLREMVLGEGYRLGALDSQGGDKNGAQSHD